MAGAAATICGATKPATTSAPKTSADLVAGAARPDGDQTGDDVDTAHERARPERANQLAGDEAQDADRGVQDAQTERRLADKGHRHCASFTCRWNPAAPCRPSSCAPVEFLHTSATACRNTAQVVGDVGISA
jgi:hypothetical protein